MDIHQKHDEEYLGNSYIISESPKLTIILNANEEIGLIGQTKLIYKQIDNSFNTIYSSLNFQQGGTITVPYGVEFNDLYDKISSISNSYLKIVYCLLFKNRLSRPFSCQYSSKLYDFKDCLLFTFNDVR